MSEILFHFILITCLSAAVPLLIGALWQPANRSERAVHTGGSLLAAALLAAPIGLMPVTGAGELSFIYPALAVLLALATAYSSLTLFNFLHERSLVKEAEMAGRVSRFSLANYARLDLEGEDFLSTWTLNEVQRLDNWTPAELELIKYMIAHIDRIGHLIGVMSAPVPGGSAHASIPVYNICRADLESYEGKAKRRLWDWQYGSWCAQLS